MHRTHMIKAGVWYLAMSLMFSGLARASDAKPRLSMSAARSIALDKGAGRVKSQELEKEKGRWIYSFDIASGKEIHEVNVDANTGDVVEDSVESPADEGKEKAREKKR